MNLDILVRMGQRKHGQLKGQLCVCLRISQEEPAAGWHMPCNGTATLGWVAQSMETLHKHPALAGLALPYSPLF